MTSRVPTFAHSARNEIDRLLGQIETLARPLREQRDRLTAAIESGDEEQMGKEITAELQVVRKFRDSIKGVR